MTVEPWLGRYVVYRIFGSDRCLYVGCTRSFDARMAHHRLGQPWAGEVVRVKVTIHLDKRAALDVERAEIARLRPRFNIYGRGPRTAWTADDYIDVLDSYLARDLNDAWDPRAQARRINRLIEELFRRFPNDANECDYTLIHPLPAPRRTQVPA